YIIVGTAAVKNPGFLHDACGAFPGHIIVGLDAKDGKVATDGWSKMSGHEVIDLAKKFEGYGVESIIYTDIGRNACSQAYDLHSPNLPQGTTAEREVGLEGHVTQDINLYFKEWGFDYIKIDACGLADFLPDSDLVKKQDYRAAPPLIERGSINRTDVKA
ncbi:hypothetical protein LTR94_032636, partial [Friedmanniomyces endolithicus]